MIELVAFSKSYSSKKDDFVVSDISMTCKKGEITGLLGVNGAGKTTVLKAISARHFATSGKVFVEGLDAEENFEKIRNITGFVEEEPNLFGEYTVAEYLKMIGKIHGGKMTSSLDNLLRISEIAKKKIRTLSKGQRQRVNFARSLIYEPKVLILDEPASGLDPAQIVNMRSLVKSLKKDRTILLSTHLMQEVDSLCDKIYILHEGKIVASGTPSQIVTETGSKNLEEAFFCITSNGETKK